MGLMVLLWLGCIVTPWRFKGFNISNQVLQFMVGGDIPTIALLMWKVLFDQLHECSYGILSFCCLAMRISDLPEVMLVQPWLKVEKAFHCTKNTIHMFDVHVASHPSSCIVKQHIMNKTPDCSKHSMLVRFVIPLEKSERGKQDQIL